MAQTVLHSTGFFSHEELIRLIFHYARVPFTVQIASSRDSLVVRGQLRLDIDGLQLVGIGRFFSI